MHWFINCRQQIDEGFAEEDLESNLQRDKYARLCSTVNQLIDELTPSAPDFQLREACDQLVRLAITERPRSDTDLVQLNIIFDTPDMQSQLVSAHGMLAIMEVLESRTSRDVTLRLLQIVNTVSLLVPAVYLSLNALLQLVTADSGFLESFCLIG